MKIVERTFTREIAVAPAPILWNYWDHEHLYVVHQSYTSASVLYDDEKAAVYMLKFRVPIFSFLKSDSMNVMIRNAPNQFKQFNKGLFGMPVYSTFTVKEIRKDYCEISMNYKFILTGWRQLLAPFLSRMMEVWNQRVWEEDLPLKLRRHKVLRLGFRDFIGLPEKVEDRHFDGPIPFELPVKRHKDSPLNFRF